MTRYWNGTKAANASARPIQSKRTRRCVRSSGSATNSTAAAASAISADQPNALSQLPNSTSEPAISGPSVEPATDTMEKPKNARAISLGWWTVKMIIAEVVNSAPSATPCAIRSAISAVALGASTHSSVNAA